MAGQGSLWRDGAACRDEDPELFFPIGTSGPAHIQIAAAKVVCGRCPVSSQCLSWALDSGEDIGVWGGMDADERRSLRAAAPHSRRPSPSGNPV